MTMQNSPPVQSGLTAAQTQAQAAQNAIAVNQAIRDMQIANSTEVKQNIFSQNYVTPNAQGAQVNIPFRNVGMIKYFIVRLQGVFSEIGGGDTCTATNWNIANLLSNVTLFDLDNYQRINAFGWFLNMLASMKEQFPQGSALLNSAFDEPIKYGNNFNCLSLVAPTSSATGSFQMFYVVPCTYTARDWRGGLFSGVVNATGYLQFTITTTPFVASTGDPTLAIWTGTQGTPTTISQLTVNVYQVYADQLIRYTSGPNTGTPILGPIDMATQYRLVNTALTGIAAGQDFAVPFTNFQQFLSLGIIYDQNGTLNPGTDINAFKVAAANTYIPFNVDPITQSWLTRHALKTDLPLGSYNFSFRGQPINTNQTGNMQLLINAITAANGTVVMAGFEAFALTSTVLGAASLPAT